METSQQLEPKPFLRWAGGKRLLVDIIIESTPKSFFRSDKNFFEPFVGGGALMFRLGAGVDSHFVPGNRVHINDINPELICTYEVVRDDVEGLIVA